MVARSPGPQANSVNLAISTPQSSPAIQTRAPTVAAPNSLALLASIRSLEIDSKRLGALVPSLATDLDGLVRNIRGTLGEGIGSEVDLTRPVYWAMSTDQEESIAFSMYLLPTKFGAGFPPSLELVAKAPDIDSIHLRDGHSHEWVVSDAVCEVHRRPRPNGVLVCAPSQHGLDEFGVYVAGLSEHPPASTPALQLELTPSQFNAIGKDSDWAWLQPLLRDLSAVSLNAGFDETGVTITAQMRSKAGNAGLAPLLAALASADAALPPEFAQVPDDALFAVTLKGTGRSAPAAAQLQVWAEHCAGLVDPDPNMLPVVSKLNEHAAGRPTAVAYGYDFKVARDRLQKWVDADNRDPAGSAPRGDFRPGVSWLLFRLDPPNPDAVFKAMSGSRIWRSPGLTGNERLRPDVLHRVISESQAKTRTAAPSVLAHAYLVRAKDAILVALSTDESVARAQALKTLEIVPGRAPLLRYFRQRKGDMAALGFIRPELLVAQSLDFDTSYSRSMTLVKLKDLLEFQSASVEPAAIIGTVDTTSAQTPRADVRLVLSGPTLENLLQRVHSVL